MSSLTVTDLVGAIKQNLESNFRAVTVSGEVSNLSPSAAGHWYFTLSDESSSLSVALFKMDAFRNPFIKKVKNGDMVTIAGPISVYQKRGSFQLLAKKILPQGVGNLARQYEILKEKLTVEGLFDISLKKEIPKFPNRVGVITALKGAALQDFLNTLKRRSFWGEVIIIPALVQGENSATSLRNALKLAMQTELLDCLVLTRGGGAIEDLWSFNDEGLIRDLFECPIPIISAVGHQVDFTLCDLVADKRMETPTAAAEILSEHHKELFTRLNFIQHKLKSMLYEKHTEIEKRLTRIKPHNILIILKDKFSKLKERVSSLDLDNQLEQRGLGLVGFYEKEQYLDELQVRLVRSVESRAQKHQLKMSLIEGKLTGLDPKKVLKRGYTLIQDNENNLITNQKKFNKIKQSTDLTIQFHDGVGVVQKKTDK